MKQAVFLSLFVLMCLTGWSNNIQVSNINLSMQDLNNNTSLVGFDITWENSWRIAGGANNWDAAWIFVKYRITGGPWLHAWLANTGHTSCANGTIQTGLLNPGTAYNEMTNPGLGVFLYRSSVGNGTFTCSGIKLKWNYGANGIPDDEQVEIKVFALEMVYVPQGAFYLGSGGTEHGAFYTYNTPTNPYLVSNENAIQVGPSAGNLYYPPGGTYGDQSGPIPALYPKGFKAVYVMKYEISQQGYADFLNTLTRTQQAGCVKADLIPTISHPYVLTDTNIVLHRNVIACSSEINPNPATVHFFCDLNDDGIGSANDGQDIACGYLHIKYVASYLDWAGLRPMTDLEIEKFGRGTRTAIANEYVWGNLQLLSAMSVVNSGMPSEYGTNASGMANCNHFVANGFNKPLRCGSFARVNTDRTLSGASYYGIQDLGGNVMERIMSAGSTQGRGFLGNHGNGILAANGFSDVASWPNGVSTGTGFRGGGFQYAAADTRVSSRIYAADTGDFSEPGSGGRGCRTAP